MIFLALNWLWLTLAVIIFVMIGLTLLYTRTRINLQRIHPDSLRYVYPLSFVKLRWRLLLIALGLVGMSIMLLRPALLTSSQTKTVPKMDIVLAVDISPSMRTRDLRPDRLEYAKQQLSQLVNELGQYRMSLVMFSGEAIMQTPMTPDPASILTAISTLSPENISAKGTRIDEALLSAREAFTSTPPSFRKIVILVTDGEDHGSGLTTALSLLQKDRIRVYSIGIGSTAGAPVPVFDDNGNVVDYKKDDQGRTVVSKLDPAVLNQISHATGGQAYILGQEQADWRGLLSQIQQLELGKARQRLNDQNAREIGGLILFPSLLLILMGLALPIRLAPLILLVMFAVMNNVSVYASERFNLEESIRNEVANHDVGAKRLSPALQKYMKNTATLPRNAATHYNLANTLQYTGRSEEAQSEWAQALNAKPDRKLAAKIAYNKAVQNIQAGQYDKAQQSLVKSLKLWAPDVDAKKNLEMTLLELKRKQQQKPQSSNGKGSNGENKQQPNQGQPGKQQGQFSKEQSEQILDSLLNNKMLRPDQKQKRDDDAQDW